MSILSKNTRKRAKRTVKSLPGRVRDEPGKAVKTAAGIAAAAAAGVAAVRMIRKNGHDGELHVRAADGEGWMLTTGGSNRPLQKFARKREAIEAGRELASKREGTLLIHRTNGEVSRRHVYSAS